MTIWSWGGGYRGTSISESWLESWRGSLAQAATGHDTESAKTISKTAFCEHRKTQSPNLINLVVYEAFWERFGQKGTKGIQKPLLFSLFPYAFSRSAETMENQ